MTERPNICFIFEKLSVQGCQIWHSHVSMPFNSAPAHSTRPHNAKKALYVIISAKIPENLVHKSCCLTVIFDEAADFLFSPCQVVPGACLSQIVTNSDTSNTHKHPKTPTNTHKTPTKSGATTLSWKSGWKPLTRREFWHLRIIFIIFRFRVTAV